MDMAISTAQCYWRKTQGVLVLAAQLVDPCVDKGERSERGKSELLGLSRASKSRHRTTDADATVE